MFIHFICSSLCLYLWYELWSFYFEGVISAGNRKTHRQLAKRLETVHEKLCDSLILSVYTWLAEMGTRFDSISLHILFDIE